MVKNLKKEKAILTDQTDAKRADFYTYSFMQIVSTHVPFSHVCDNISSLSTVLQFHNFFTSHISDYAILQFFYIITEIYIITEAS